MTTIHELRTAGIAFPSSPTKAAAVTTNNPFAREIARGSENAASDSFGSREVAEVQAAMVVAKRFPRDQIAAMDRILQACTRPTLAEDALYSYSRGGSDISGPTIRLAEAMAQCWGNIQFGVRELEQRDGVSTVEAYAWDIETNARVVKLFQVSHRRHTRKGSYLLEDARDIYENVANQGARRLRACILAVIPGDVTEAAVRQCEETMAANADTSPEAVKKLADAFAAIGVTQAQIEKRIQRRLETIRPAQVVHLRKVFASIRDGMSGVGDWFEGAGDQPQKPEPQDAKPEPTRSEVQIQAQGRKEPEAWPRQNEQGIWVDSNGEAFDPEAHAQNREGIPSVKADGSFRAKRGTASEREPDAKLTLGDLE